MLREYKVRIEPQDGRQRLDEFLASRIGSLSRMRIGNLIEAGACRVNGSAGRRGYRIVAGDDVEFSFDDEALTSMFPEAIQLDVVHEDEHLIVVVKPAGMLVHPTLNVKSGTLANALAHHVNRSRIVAEESRIDPRSSILDFLAVVRPGLVHRLDRATSGLMVVARTQRALATLSRHFRKRLVEKRYVALVHGKVAEESGSINAPIGRDPNQQPPWRVMEGGKSAETRFKVLDRSVDATLLELEPITGRTNQLRIHCAHIGHPIVGDEMHWNFAYRISNCELKRDDRIAESEIRNPKSEIRLCLHASKLSFHHPAHGKWMSFCSPLPEDISQIARRYRFQSK